MTAPSSVVDRWREFLSGVDPSLGEVWVGDPASEEDIATAETARGLPFPAVLRALLLEANGLCFRLHQDDGEGAIHIWSTADHVRAGDYEGIAWERGLPNEVQNLVLVDVPQPESGRGLLHDSPKQLVDVEFYGPPYPMGVTLTRYMGERLKVAQRVLRKVAKRKRDGLTTAWPGVSKVLVNHGLAGARSARQVKQLSFTADGPLDLGALSEFERLQDLHIDLPEVPDLGVLAEQHSKLKRLTLNLTHEATWARTTATLPNVESVTLSGLTECSVADVLNVFPRARHAALSFRATPDLHGDLRSYRRLQTLAVSSDVTSPLHLEELILPRYLKELALHLGLTAFPKVAGGSLHTLSLGDRIAEVALDDITHLKALDSLVLSMNQLQDLGDLSRLPQLTSLDLTGNRLTDVAAIRRLKKLERLLLSHNAITRVDLRGLTRLSELSLAANPLSEIDGLGKLKRLDSLALWGNELPKARLAEIRREIEGLRRNGRLYQALLEEPRGPDSGEDPT